MAHFTDGLVPLFGRRVPIVVTVLDLTLVSEWRTHRPVRYARIPLVIAAPRLADQVIAISQATADDIMRFAGVSSRKIHVIPLAPRTPARQPNPASIAAAAAKYHLPPNGYLLVPGTIEPRKNHVRVVAAFEHLIRRNAIKPDVVLALVGQVGWKASRALDAIALSPVHDRIRMLGYVPDDDMTDLMAGAAAVVFASTSEGFGLPILEAMACGAPVVTSNLSSMPEVAGGAGILVDPFDVASIAVGIETAMHADGTARANARNRAALFSWAATAKATAAVYDRIRG